MASHWDPVRDAASRQPSSISDQTPASQVVTTLESTTYSIEIPSTSHPSNTPLSPVVSCSSGPEHEVSGTYYSSNGGCPTVTTRCRPPPGFQLTVVDPNDMTSWTMKTPWQSEARPLMSGIEARLASRMVLPLKSLSVRLDAELQLNKHSGLGPESIKQAVGRLADAVLSQNPCYEAWHTAREGWRPSQQDYWTKHKMLALFVGLDTSPQDGPAEQFRYANVDAPYRISEKEVSDAVEYWMTCMAADPCIHAVRYRQPPKTRWDYPC